MSDLKGITYADKPQIGIPIAIKLLENKNHSDYISAAVYLGYRILDNTYSNKDYTNILKAAFEKSIELDIKSMNGYRWHLSLNLLNACINALSNNPPKLELENLQNIYDLGLYQPNQLCNYSKIGTLIYYHTKDHIFKNKILSNIKYHMLYGNKLDNMSYDAIHDVVIPILSDDMDIATKAINKYKHWYIYKHYINTLIVYTKTV